MKDRIQPPNGNDLDQKTVHTMNNVLTLSDSKKKENAVQQNIAWLSWLLIATIVVGGVIGRATLVEAQSTGACCLAGGGCLDGGTESTCTSSGGVFHTGIFCLPSPCSVSNEPPDCSLAEASPDILWPPDHMFVPIEITGITDPDGDAFTITVTSIFQDEEVVSFDDIGAGNTFPDGKGVGTATAEVRAERSSAGTRDGRVYRIYFSADDSSGGTCSDFVTVCVPHDRSDDTCVDQGALEDSIQSGP